MCDRLTSTLLCLSQSGCDATDFISITLRETPKLTAYTGTLRHISRHTRVKETQKKLLDIIGAGEI